MPKIYDCMPDTKAGRKAWYYFVDKNKEVPKRIYKMPNAFRKQFNIANGKWGMWIAEYQGWFDFYNPQTEKLQVKNMFDFFSKQTLLENITKKLF